VRAPADGYTLLVTDCRCAINATLVDTSISISSVSVALSAITAAPLAHVGPSLRPGQDGSF